MVNSVSPARPILSVETKAFLFLLAVAAAVVAGYAYRQHHRYKHVAVHDPGKVYRASWVDPDVMTQLIEEHQIRTVVNLCAPGESGEHRWALERETVHRAGARLLELSMPTTESANDPDLQPHLSALANPDNYPMLVHCKDGVIRTAKFLAMYDIRIRGQSAEDSLAAQPFFGRSEDASKLTAFCRDFEASHRSLYPESVAHQPPMHRH